ncbi:tetratricopeptide repeat protein [Thalassotalea fusca]
MRLFGVLFFTFFVTLFISGCQSTAKSTKQPTNFLHDTEIFADDYFEGYGSVDIESLEEVFALNDEMRELVAKRLLPERDEFKRAERLLRILFLEKENEIDYRYGANLVAQDAFDNREANCMSLTIMAYALAEAADLKASFQDVDVPEYWIRSGTYSMLTGHVNISIKKQREVNVAVVWGNEAIEIDFDPLVAKRSFPKKKISKNTVLAMFYNNKGAQFLVDDDFVSAYGYFKASIETDPFFAAAWGNLGILYRKMSMYDHAERAYKTATDIDGDNLTALTNYALLLRTLGKIDRAELIEKSIHQQRLSNPYYHAMLADEAHYAGDYRKAISNYRKAIKLDSKVHEFYFGLAKVYFDLNELASAKAQLKRAIRLSKRSSIHKKYEAKLAVLNAYNR